MWSVGPRIQHDLMQASKAMQENVVQFKPSSGNVRRLVGCEAQIKYFKQACVVEGNIHKLRQCVNY